MGIDHWVLLKHLKVTSPYQWQLGYVGCSVSTFHHTQSYALLMIWGCLLSLP